MDILSADGPFLKFSYNIGFMQTYSESCVLNKKGCHFPAAPANPSHMPSLPETSRTTSTIFRANFSRLNFDSGAKILGDIIKYDYLGKRERKRERKEEEKKPKRGCIKEGGEERAPRRHRKRPLRWEETTNGRVRPRVKSCRGMTESGTRLLKEGGRH